jgi:hypothetical protein
MLERSTVHLVAIYLLAGCPDLVAAEAAAFGDVVPGGSSLSAASMYQASAPPPASALLASTLGAGSLERDRYPMEASLGIGVLFPGTVTYGDDSTDADTDAGFMMKLDLDYFPIKYLGVGAFLTAAFPGVEDSTLKSFEIGPAIKGRFPIPIDQQFTLLITPGFSVGYRGISGEFLGESRYSNGLALDFGVDLRLQWDHLEFFIEPGFITQPVGGTSEVDLKFGPIGYTLFGVGYAF